MKIVMIFFKTIFLLGIFLLTCYGCQNKDISNKVNSDIKQIENVINIVDNTAVTLGREIYNEFVVDNVYHSKDNGDVHFSIYVPKNYDGCEPYALYISLCGYGGYYFQGVGINLQQENFVFEAKKFNSRMIIVAPQLNDWGKKSADQAISLIEYLLIAYNIDKTKVFANGYSGGGETLSLIMSKKPELFTAILHVSSIWRGELEFLVNSRIPVYFVIGDSDEYYGSTHIIKTYEMICALYRTQNLNDVQIAKLAVLDIKSQNYFIERGVTNQHIGGKLIAFDNQIMGWLFNR